MVSLSSAIFSPNRPIRGEAPFWTSLPLQPISRGDRRRPTALGVKIIGRRPELTLTSLSANLSFSSIFSVDLMRPSTVFLEFSPSPTQTSPFSFACTISIPMLWKVEFLEISNPLEFNSRLMPMPFYLYCTLVIRADAEGLINGLFPQAYGIFRGEIYYVFVKDFYLRERVQGRELKLGLLSELGRADGLFHQPFGVPQVCEIGRAHPPPLYNPQTHPTDGLVVDIFEFIMLKADRAGFPFLVYYLSGLRHLER